MIDYSDVSADLATGTQLPKFASDTGAKVKEFYADQQRAGFEPLKTLPAQYHNWLLQRTTDQERNDATCLKSLVQEANNLLAVAGESADGTDDKQLAKMFAYDDVDSEGGEYIQEVVPKNIKEHSATAVLDTVNCEYCLAIVKKDNTDPLNPVYSMEKAAALPVALGGTGATTAQGIYDLLESYIQAGITPDLQGHKLVFGTI